MLRVVLARVGPVICCLSLLPACGASDDGGNADDDGGILTTGPSSSSGSGSGEETMASSSSGNDTDCPPGGCLDVVGGDSMGTAGEGTTGGDCDAPEHVPCDDTANDIIKAMGLNCPGEPIVNATVGGAPGASGTLAAFGTTTAFSPTEGLRYAVIGSGFVADLPVAGGLTECSQDVGAYDPTTNLPAPIVPVNVGGGGCAVDPGLIGTGDCSNTIQAQFSQAAAGAFDYTEVRFDTTVPAGVTSFSYDFAFFSYEYPVYYDSQYNDIYIGWLESEQWTGNISFDDNGNPISLNAGFMDFLDADVDFPMGSPHPDCPAGAGCTAPELHGTCMQGHGGTRWLSTQASVTPGENITVVFAIMDLGDSVLDSYAFLDNFQWGCEGGNPPSTTPID